MEPIWNLIIYFSVCAFIGWILQAIEDLFQRKKITNTGFLYGPFIPLFGFTALIIYFFNLYFVNYSLQFRLIIFFILPTLMEYFTGILLEKVFYVRLWDYSKQRFNFKGRISLLASMIWFILILLQVFVLQVIIFNGINQFNEIFRIILAITLIIYFSIDFFFSAKVFYYFAKIKREFEKEGKTNLEKLNKKIRLRIRSIQRKMKISPVFKRNIKDDFEKFIERVSKK
jgi:uncharacterized membrane protein